LIETWLPLSNALNSLNRAMGLQDIYPFILSPPVVAKLSAIHDIIHGNTRPEKPQAAPLDQARSQKLAAEAVSAT
jgi:hypothetical protein